MHPLFAELYLSGDDDQAYEDDRRRRSRRSRRAQTRSARRAQFRGKAVRRTANGFGQPYV